MNTNFYCLLKKVNANDQGYLCLDEQLENEYYKLVKKLNKLLMVGGNTMQQFIIHSLNQINEEQNRIAELYYKLRDSANNDCSPAQLEQIDLGIDYYNRILVMADNAKGELLEMLAAYYPEKFDNEHNYKELKKHLRFSIVTKHITATRKPEVKPTDAPSFTQTQIALIYVYNDLQQITKTNGLEIAKKYGYESKNSGHKLYQLYIKYLSLNYRKAMPDLCTPKRLSNKINLLESVLPYLNEIGKSKCLDEVKILKRIYESEYQ